MFSQDLELGNQDRRRLAQGGHEVPDLRTVDVRTLHYGEQMRTESAGGSGRGGEGFGRGADWISRLGHAPTLCRFSANCMRGVARKLHIAFLTEKIDGVPFNSLNGGS